MATDTLESDAKLKANTPQPMPVVAERMSERVILTLIADPSCGDGALPRFGFWVTIATPHPAGPAGTIVCAFGLLISFSSSIT